MNELIKISDFNGEKTCNARELHNFLEIRTRFNDWINNRINKYSFVENIDYTVVTKKLVTEGKDYYLSLDMAKHLSMVENNEKGQEARMYFIACEKQLKQELMKPTTSIDYDLIGKIVGVAVLTAINETTKQSIRPIKKLKKQSTPPKNTGSAFSFMDEWFIIDNTKGIFKRKEVYSDYQKYCHLNAIEPLGLKNFYAEFRLNSNVSECKKGGENYFKITSLN